MVVEGAHPLGDRAVERPHLPDVIRAHFSDFSQRNEGLSRAAAGGVPLEQPPSGLLLADRALVEADLEQERERLADRRGPAACRAAPSPAGRRASGRIASSSSCSAQLARCAPRARPCAAASCGRLALVARRAVAARQLVELVEQVAGVAHVAAHRRVGPPHRGSVWKRRCRYDELD